MTSTNPSKSSSQAAAYFSSKPCRNGHISWRYVSGGECIECGKSKRKQNLGKDRAIKAKRRAARLQRIPRWADLRKIKDFYKACPKGYHVDHFYPLQGKYCSGLHVIENLRHIPAKENISKGNRMPQDFYLILPKP